MKTKTIEPSARKGRDRRRHGRGAGRPLYTALTICSVLLVCFGAFGQTPLATRTISGTNVSLASTPIAGVNAYAVEETIPAGLTPANINQSGAWDSVNRKVKWGPFLDSVARTLSYTVGGSNGTYTLSGAGSSDGAGAGTTGNSALTIGQPGPGASAVARTISGASVSLASTPIAGVNAYAVEETLPAGLTPANITQSGAWDSVNRKVKWGPFLDSVARTLTYTVSGPNGTYTLNGAGSFDGASVGATGNSSLVISAGLPDIRVEPLTVTIQQSGK